MRVHVICRLNQARSIIAAAALRKLYPEIEVFSSGIQAQTGQPIPQLISEIATRWGLGKIDYLSTNFQSGELIKNDDLVLCADISIYLHLDSLGLPAELIDVTTFALTEVLTPSDPVAMSLFATEIELSKMVIATNSALQNYLRSATTGVVEALIYPQGGEIEVSRLIRNWLAKNKGVVFDMNWRIPEGHVWTQSGLEVSEFNPRRLESMQGSLIEGAVTVSAFEIDNQIDRLTQPSWSTLLASIQGPVLLLVQSPDGGTALMPESIFSLIHASRVQLAIDR